MHRIVQPFWYPLFCRIPNMASRISGLSKISYIQPDTGMQLGPLKQRLNTFLFWKSLFGGPENISGLFVRINIHFLCEYTVQWKIAGYQANSVPGASLFWTSRAPFYNDKYSPINVTRNTRVLLKGKTFNLFSVPQRWGMSCPTVSSDATEWTACWTCQGGSPSQTTPTGQSLWSSTSRWAIRGTNI